ncbi:MAG: large subunit ribosomal protein [Candidatus Woesearchaeota archaeon]|nr:large subunit ribosomal protein [Candidatus Woesearchaeota archaeon]MDN5327995.1 large subunit ribosomal protein [Candidatus Woesearchaeota archaeon]
MVKVIPFRRKREGRTDYHRRLKLLKSGKPRLVLRLTNTGLIAQLTEFDPSGDKVIFGTTSKSLSKFGWDFSKKSLPASYLFGVYVGKLCKKHKVTDFVVDIGLRKFQKKGRVSAFLKGLADVGLETSHDPEVFPDDDRISGKHIVEFAKTLKENDEASFNKQFSEYLSKGLDVLSLSDTFEKVKTKIMESDI